MHFKYSQHRALCFAFISTLGVILPAQASDNLERASMAACEKMKACTLESLAGQDGVTPQMRQMVEGMVAGICENMMDFSEVNAYPELHKPAAACLQSIADSTCSSIENGSQTPECEALDKLTEQYEQ